MIRECARSVNFPQTGAITATVVFCCNITGLGHVNWRLCGIFIFVRICRRDCGVAHGKTKELITDMAFIPEEYEVRCYQCKIQFNALESVWCNCLVSQHTLVCPGCLNCFCKAPTAFKIKFWAGAPQILWDREIELHKRDLTLKPNPRADEAPHPLVLVVDDEVDILKLACRAIQDCGYASIYAQNGIQGLELVKIYRPELVLSDALMPRMDGREMCRNIKKDPELNKTKVVIMTSLYTQSKYKTEAYREFLVDAYLNKPLEYNQLREILHRYLG